MPSLPEDLVILAVGARPRGGPDNGKLPLRFRYGLRGAVLVALTLAGRVELADEQIVVRDPSPQRGSSLGACRRVGRDHHVASLRRIVHRRRFVARASPLMLTSGTRPLRAADSGR